MPRKLFAASGAATLALLGALLPATSGVAATPSHAAQVSAIRTSATSDLYSGGLYVQPDSVAAKQAAALAAAGRTTDAAAAAYIAKRPVAIWLGDWFTGASLVKVIQKNVALAEQAGTTPVFVTYAIPDRDCGGYSAGGLSAGDYTTWNQTIATTIHGHRATVLIEPDSLGQTTTCAGVGDTRFSLLSTAVQQFSAAGVPAYLDGGNSRWLKPAAMAALLNRADVAQARGFYTNVSNYIGVTDERAYAEQISALTGGSHYVIDVSRNGRGWKGTWCNAPGAGLGQDPHATYGTTRLDALLWVKTPGSSDGSCNGGPAAGAWFASYANSLVALRK
ncbi:glycoside hydrolase family 6 protein [Frondihabitans peucedani]|uniref:Glucanase n=1 Tax=Frondihabitans peucedani TaxID=598626 RepID=A0ABP8E611_9MICO